MLGDRSGARTSARAGLPHEHLRSSSHHYRRGERSIELLRREGGRRRRYPRLGPGARALRNPRRRDRAGFVRTPILDAMQPDVLQTWIDRAPLKRLGEPSEIFAGVRFIFECEFFTGKYLEIDGGLTS